MRISLYILTFCVAKFATCGDTGQESSGSHTWDISLGARNKNVVIQEEVFNETQTVVCTPANMDEQVNSLVDGAMVIWQPGAQERLNQCRYTIIKETPTLVLDVYNGNTALQKYYAKEKDKWTLVKEGDFVKKFSIASRAHFDQPIPQDTEDKVSIDLAKPVDESKIKIHETKKDGVDEKKFEVKGKISISSVADDGVGVWIAPESGALVVTLFSQKRFPNMMAIRHKKDNKDEFLYFAKVYGSWRQIKVDLFHFQLNTMKKYAKEGEQKKNDAAALAIMNGGTPSGGRRAITSGDNISSALEVIPQ
ncbi:signal peptide-containing protein [Theileria equi strain WA]|uniref:Signal peptide-containing protein n=1 Tax=Theileria equi strain WA TaxID=1537102 RepID=L0AY56_THEEQ|nr:signal peptide-containing protein [Theileria equi strain WA]AFZ79839.1 signal peptide-containing protein [Theileria equi strain WA]|eukprot:XP_004829505.1 signal peptide-containing protein [Theileria equi strain WA]